MARKQKKQQEPDWRTLAKSLAIIESLLPGYELFASLAQWGNAEQLHAIVKLLWQRAASEPVSMNIESQIAKIDAINPDPAEFDMFGVWPAQDACVGLVSVLEWCADPEVDIVDHLDRLAVAGIERYLEAVGDIDDHHPLCEDYQAFREVVDQLLCSQNKAASLVVQQLRECIALACPSNIGLASED